MKARAQGGIVERWFEHLPVTEATPIVTLGEGDTPLLFSEHLSAETGAEVWLKQEGMNPTGSFKDRGMTVAVSKLLEEGSSAVVCASTGNTSASAAAYASRAGLKCGVLIPRGKVASGKLAQALAHGALVIEIDGNFDRALELTKEIAAAHAVTLVNSINPHRIAGQKTAAYEITDALGSAPDLHLMPVGNAGNITAYWRGYREALALGWIDSCPVMYGWQAQGSDPIVRGEVIASPATVASAIRIGNPASWNGALEAATSSRGAIRSVTDSEILLGQRSLAAEGLFVEPAAAAGVAGLRRLSSEGAIPRSATVVCVLTGHGLKDPERAIADLPAPRCVPARLEPILEALDLA